MVELTILGNYGPYAPASSACSGYLLDADGFYIMLDCGNGSFSQLQKHMDYTKLNLLILTHLHPDHYSDMFCLRQALSYQMREGHRREPLFVYLPEGPAALTETFSQWSDVFTLVSLEEAMAVTNDFNRFQLEFFPVQHQLPAYGVSFSVDGQRLLTYTGDTGWFPKLSEYCANTKVLLAEASLREYELEQRGANHMTARQAGQLAQRCGAEQLILTHFFPEANLHQSKREAEQTFEGKVYLSKTGKRFLLQP